MTYDVLIALVGFAFVSSITPGPNNLMLMASGANFGFRRTLPHMLGISLGHMFMVSMVGLGLGEVFDRLPWLKLVLAGLSSLYLLYLAWKIANAAAPKGGEAEGKPFTFLQAAGFQWVNPKAWWMAIHAVTNLSPEGGGIAPVLWVAGVFAMTNFPSIMVWTTMGMQVKRFLTRPRMLRTFNLTMAVVLILTLWPVWAEILRGV